MRALDGVSLEIEQGEFVALVGTSGSAKSTLLNLIAGLDHATGGSLEVFGQDLAQMSRADLSIHRRRNVGIIFQSFNLVSSMTAAENVARRPACWSSGAHTSRPGYIVSQGGTAGNLFSLPLWLIAAAMGFAVLVSLASGAFPARRAARLDPIQALRHD